MKAPSLSPRKKMEIGKYAANNPSAKMTDIAKEFNVTYYQVIYALKLFREGRLHKKRPRQKTQLLESIVQEKTTEEIINEQYKLAAAQMQSDTKIPVDERISMLEKLVSMRKTLQAVMLENHIKRTDAGIIALIIRKFKPDASDDDVITIYKEALELWKIK